MQQTEYYDLHKPDYTDVIDVAVLNDNADIIDAALKTNADAIADIQPPDIEPIPNTVIERLFQ